MTRFIHTADWQIGKPFARIEDPDKRALVRRERLDVLKRIGGLAAGQGAEFVLVAGDVFDSTTPDASTISAACSAIGALGLPVLAIPGNHDHAGPGSVWEQDFFLREQRALAANLRVLLKPEPVDLGGVILLPCPLAQRRQAEDPTAWLRDPAVLAGLDGAKPRVVLAHGSVQGFSSATDGEEGTAAANPLDLERLAPGLPDYIALGDWHGTRQVSGKAWYAGTPEPDRFVKGGGHDPGNVLLVELAGRGQAPHVGRHRTAGLNWLTEEFALAGPESLAALQSRLDGLLGGRAQSDLLELTLRGHLGLRDDEDLRQVLASLRARLLRLKLDSSVQVTPADAEIQALADRPDDPLVAAVARQLRDEMQAGPGDAAAVARQAFRELFAIVAARGEAPHAS